MTATTGIVTTLTANTVTSLGAVSGTTGTFSGAVSGTTGTFTSHVSLGDSDELRLGDATGGDLKIYHDGTNDRIDSSGTFLILEANNHIFRNTAGNEDYAKFLGNGAVELYYDNSKKFETNTNGVYVKGNIQIEEESGSEYYRLHTNSYGGLEIQNETTKVAEFTDANTFELQDNLKFAVDGKGIDFSTTEGSGATASILDDYEEGTYTPVISASGTTYTYSTNYELRSSSSVTSSNSIAYVKIGSMVYLNFAMFWNSSNTIRYVITLPFTAKGSAYALCVTPASFQVSIAGDMLGTLGISNNSTAFDTYRILNDTGTGGHGTVPLTSSSEVYYQICYEAL